MFETDFVLHRHHFVRLTTARLKLPRFQLFPTAHGSLIYSVCYTLYVREKYLIFMSIVSAFVVKSVCRLDSGFTKQIHKRRKENNVLVEVVWVLKMCRKNLYGTKIGTVASSCEDLGTEQVLSNDFSFYLKSSMAKTGTIRKDFYFISDFKIFHHIHHSHS